MTLSAPDSVTVEAFDAIVLDSIRRNGGDATAPELLEMLLDDHQIDGSGEAILEMSQFNLVIWSGLHPVLADSITRLLDRKKLQAKRANWFSFFAAGRLLDLPMAKRVPAKGYKSPHWMPTIFALVQKSDHAK